jgi:hypothetical protein
VFKKREGKMGIDAYVDGVLELIRGAGVTDAEIDQAETPMKLEHMFMKGVDFETAARAICRVHNIKVG